MHTNILVVHHKKTDMLRWLAAALLAWSLAFTLTLQAHAAACTPTQSLNLWAKAGTLTLPDSTTVNIWGYSDSAAGAAQLPGPTLTVNQGDCVEVTLHNDLAEITSLALHGQGLPADTTGAAPSSTTVYTFSAVRPGTYLYEAGLTNNGARQVAMGLYGALVVRPATAPGTYSSETTLVLSEIDPDLNAAPTTFDMGEYKPQYWLINGQTYPNIPAPSLAKGSTARVRYVNAGLNENSMGLLGLTQQVIAADGYPVPGAYTVVAETIPPGGTLDTLVSIPAAAASGTQYALYSTAQHLDNNGAAYGGQLLFITVNSSTPTDQPPTVNAGTDQPITLPAAANLDGTVTDDGLSALTTAWSMTSGPGTVTFGNASLVDTTASFSAAGVYVLRLTATDGTGSVFDEVTITVNTAAPNTPPTVNAGADQTISVTTASLVGTVIDDGQLAPVATSWSLVSGPGIVTFTVPTAASTGVSFSALGVYTLRLTANDGQYTVTDDIVVTVNAGKHIGDLDWTSTSGLGTNWIASVTITVHNASHNPVSGATVSGTWSGGGAGGGTCITLGAGGQCIVVRVGIPGAQASNTFTVTNITGAGAQGAYASIYNHDPDTGAQASNGTSITVNHP